MRVLVFRGEDRAFDCDGLGCVIAAPAVMRDGRARGKRQGGNGGNGSQHRRLQLRKKLLWNNRYRRSTGPELELRSLQLSAIPAASAHDAGHAAGFSQRT